jgi:hypothetical protein
LAAFDMFPQTEYVETVAILLPRDNIWFCRPLFSLLSLSDVIETLMDCAFHFFPNGLLHFG